MTQPGSLLEEFAELLGCSPDAPELSDRLGKLAGLVLHRKHASGRLDVVGALTEFRRGRIGIPDLARMPPVSKNRRTS